MEADVAVYVVVIAIVLIVAAAVAVFLSRKRRSERLRDQFGPEYDRTVAQAGDEHAAERELEARQDRRQELDIRPLPAPERERFLGDWQEVQRRFVDAPDAAVRDANTLVTELMRDRGYPVEDFEQRAADISVDHPQVVEDYRAANRIAQESVAGNATTEDLRQAMVHYRALFDRLLETSTDADREVR